jgi:catechol 2,3-dioxygenase-like lactoylglutathione lyase family enzyme
MRMIQSITTTIYVSNLDRAVDFYTKTLGLPLSGRWEDHYAAIDLGKGVVIGLHPSEHSGAPVPGTRGAIQIGMSVDQPLENAVADLQAKGVVFRTPILDDGPVRLAYFGDPDGNDLYLIEVRKWS